MCHKNADISIKYLNVTPNLFVLILETIKDLACSKKANITKKKRQIQKVKRVC